MSESPESTRAADGPATYWLRPKTNRVLIGIFMLIGALGMGWLVFGPKPWAEGLDFSREAKEHVRTHAYVVKGLWIGAAINLALTIAGLVAWKFRPKEMCDLRRKDRPRKEPVSRPQRTAILVLVGAGVVTSALMMWPRLPLSLWGDEEATARRFIIGNTRRLDDDSFVLIQPKWQRTIWNWDNGTNSHMLVNILTRISHGSGNVDPADPDAFHFDARKMRLPSFIATLVMIAGAAWLTALLGAPRGSPLVAFFLALNPWIIRYGTELRGYALMMAFSVLAICFLVKALRTERSLFWWLGFALAEFLALYSHLGSVYLLIPLNLAALWIAWSPRVPGHRTLVRVADVWRLAGANLLGAAITLQLMLPNLLQFPEWVERTGRLTGKVEASWVENSLSYWASGMPWHSWDRGENPFALTLGETFASQPALTGAGLVLLAILLAAGVIHLLFRRGERIWLAPLLLPVPLMLAIAWKSETLLYDWYSVGFLPLAAIVMGCGFARIIRPFERLPQAAVLGIFIALTAGFLLPFGLISQPQRHLVRTRSVEPLAETVRHTREVVNPFHPEIDRSLTLGFVHATQLYDPAMIYARNDAQFVAALEKAEASGKELWVNAANLALGRPVFPKAYELLDDREVFEEPVVFHGLQVPCTRYLFKYKPGGVSVDRRP